MKILILIISLIAYSGLFAQSSTDPIISEPTIEHSEPLKEVIETNRLVTYQIIFTNTANTAGDSFAVTDDILKNIELLRNDTEVKFLILNEYVKIKVLPRQTINSPNFEPITTFIYE